MKIFTVNPDPRYPVLLLDYSQLTSEYWRFNCRSLKQEIAPYELNVCFGEDHGDFPIPDIAMIGKFTYAFNVKSVEIMSDVLLRFGELIPFLVEGKTWYLFNPMNSLPGILDEERSTYKYSRLGRRLYPYKCHFRKEYLSETTIFKIPNDNYHWTFCANRITSKQDQSPTFFEMINENKLTGLYFREVFDEDDAEFKVSKNAR